MFCSACGNQIQENDTFCGKCGAKIGAQKDSDATTFSRPTPVQSDASNDSDKLFAILAHLGGIFFGFIPSLIVYLVKKDSPGWVVDSVREALNWQITMIVASLVCILLSFIVIGIFMLWALLIANLVLCIIGAIKAGDKLVYRYPFAIRLLK